MRAGRAVEVHTAASRPSPPLNSASSLFPSLISTLQNQQRFFMTSSAAPRRAFATILWRSPLVPGRRGVLLVWTDTCLHQTAYPSTVEDTIGDNSHSVGDQDNLAESVGRDSRKNAISGYRRGSLVLSR